MSTIGTAGPSQHTINYDALLTTTLFNYKNVMYDNIFKASAFLAALREYDGIETINGGERIQRALMYETSATRSYSGYEQLIITPADGMTSCFFDWKEIAGSITISRREERQNSGEAAMLDLLKQKTMQSEMSLKQAVNTQLIQGTVDTATFVPGNSAKDLNPLFYFLPANRAADPLAGGNVGNISRVTYSWWRPRCFNFGANAAVNPTDFTLATTTFAGFKVAMHRAMNYCSRGADGSSPNIIVSDQVTNETYENALDVQIRYYDTKLGDMGFNVIKCKGASMVWDELVPDVYTGTVALTYGSAAFLNTKFFKLYIDSESDFVTTPFVEPENQTVKTAKILFMGNAGVTNYRKIGSAQQIALTIVA